jgi:hypothetical protein
MKQKPIFDMNSYANVLTINCPKCGSGADMHPLSIFVYFREQEDSKHGIFVKANSKTAEVHSILPPGNPSCRRDGFTIQFLCNCGTTSFLNISQHKGPTIFEMEMVV